MEVTPFQQHKNKFFFKTEIDLCCISWGDVNTDWFSTDRGISDRPKKEFPLSLILFGLFTQIWLTYKQLILKTHPAWVMAHKTWSPGVPWPACSRSAEHCHPSKWCSLLISPWGGAHNWVTLPSRWREGFISEEMATEQLANSVCEKSP